MVFQNPSRHHGSQRQGDERRKHDGHRQCHREFAVTLAVTIMFSAFVSLTLTPMMAARILKHHPETEQGKLYRWSEWCFVKTIEGYGRMVRVVLRHQFLTLLVAISTLAPRSAPRL